MMQFLSKKNRLKITVICLSLCGILSFASIVFSQDVLIKKENSSSVFKLLEYWSSSRTYPNKNIPSDVLIKAKEHSKINLEKKLNKTNEPDPWKAIGPNNIGGRTLCVAINPLNTETIYAGSAGSGLWRSYSGGIGAGAWQYVSTGFPVISVSAIVIDPVDTNRIYIGTGEVYNYEQTGTGYADKLTTGSYGIGIIKTSDGGITWEQSLNWSDSLQVGVNDIKIDIYNRNIIWAATTEGTYKNLFYGDRNFWYRVHDVKMATDLVISPTNPNRVFVACGNLGSDKNGLYKTENGGNAWTNMYVFPPTSSVFLNGKSKIDVSQSEPNILFATSGYGDYSKNLNTATWSYKTENNGTFWIPTPSPFINWASYNGWYSHDIAINPRNAKEIIAGGLYLWKSSDGGSTFKQISNGNIYSGSIEPGEPEGDEKYVHQNIHEIVYHPTNTDVIYFATDGGVFRTTDGGETFEGCNGGYQTSNFYGGFSVSQQDKNFIIGGAQGNGTNIYSGSNTWRKYVLPFDGGFTGINSLNDNVVYASYQSLNVFKSKDKGISFGHLSIPGAGTETAYIAPFALGNKDPDIIYAGREKIYKSFDGGLTWFESNKGGVLDGNPIVKITVAPQSDDVVYAATFPFEQKEAGVKAGLFRSINGGDTWTDITNGLPDRFIGSIFIDNRSYVYVTLLGFGSSHLYVSEDLGQNWKNIGSGLPDVPASAVIVDPENPSHIYLGNDLGVYLSTNSGTAWESFSTGLPDAVIISDLKILRSDRLLRASTNGAGFFERKLATEDPTVIKEEIIPSGYKLFQNYPNPFNPFTKIKFTVPGYTPKSVELKVYDILGNEIATLINNIKAPGIYEVEFNGAGFSSGVYYYKLIAGSYSITKKMILLK